MSNHTNVSGPQPLDEHEMRRVLVVVAHPDDAEYGTSAAVAHWTDQGIEVGYLLLTSGEAGMQRPPAEAGPLRALEQREACRRVGVDHLTILDFPDGVLEATLDLRRAIAREIRAFQPDTVVCGSGELIVAWGLDHADHRAAGIATIDAVRDADNRWVFPELLADEKLEPWKVSQLLITGVTPTHYVALTDSDVERAVASLAAHEAYLADLPWHPAPADFVPEMLAGMGRAVGQDRAFAFRLHAMRG